VLSDYIHSDTLYFVGLRVESVSIFTSLIVCANFNNDLITVLYGAFVLPV